MKCASGKHLRLFANDDNPDSRLERQQNIHTAYTNISLEDKEHIFRQWT